MQKLPTFRWRSLLVILMIAMIGLGAESCKPTGKMSRKEKKAQIENAKKQLRSIINGTSTLSFEDQERLINETINKNFNDSELNELLIQATQTLKAKRAEEEKIRQQRIDEARAALYDMLLNKDNKSADQLQRELDGIKAENLRDGEIDELIARVEKKIMEMRSFNAAANLPLKTQLNNAFDGIVNAARTGNMTQADNQIKNALQYFTSEDSPVLIIISREGAMVDYDKPTTIRYYLEFLKDQKGNRNNIESFKLDDNGKIKELELIKK